MYPKTDQSKLQPKPLHEHPLFGHYRSLPDDGTQEGVITGYRVWRYKKGILYSWASSDEWTLNEPFSAHNGYKGRHSFAFSIVSAVLLGLMWFNGAEFNIQMMVLLSALGLLWTLTALATCHLRGETP